jgi:AraC-like DNA-binding protein
MADSAPDGTISALVVRALLFGASQHGIDPRLLEERAGFARGTLAPANVADPDARLPARVALGLWQILPELTKNPGFGLWLAARTADAPLTVAAWFVLSSPSVEQGLERAVQYQRLLHDRASGELVREEARTRYVHRVGDATFRAPSAAIEFGFAQLVLLVRRATGRPVVPLEVRLQHARPAELSQHRPLFGENLHFGAERDEIAFDRPTLALPVVSADAALGELVHAHARALLERLPPATSSLTARVRRVLVEGLPEAAPSIDAAAAALAIAKRTLQRRLRDEGTTFELIADDVRKSLAERYLKEQRLGVQETAFLLGYSEVSAFQRAFLRWTGLSPSRWREKS